ncbi:MAG TPA: META domain-containing protein [Anaerolineales bacterium]|nr:META domain-containing protein [Anaerolineales bacterium]
MKKYLLTILVICLGISACSAKKQETSASLIGSWKLTSYGPASTQTPAVADAEANLAFNQDGTVTGNSGCNSFGGNYKVKGDQITFDQIVSTLMACDDPRMKQEDAVHKVLTDTTTYKIEGNTLTLTNNNMVLILTR